MADGASSTTDAAKSRAANLRAQLGADGEQAEIVRAPGRVNLIGEYTDFNLGFVLPAAIDLEVWIAFVPWDRPEVELWSREMDETRSFSLDGLTRPVSSTAAPARSWIDYIAGTAWAMAEAGLKVRGFRGAMDSTVPVGSGLSSSAALEMASSWALADPSSPRPEPSRMAAISQRAENAYVGVNCGIMDQFASAAGRAGQALLIDCRSNTATLAPMPANLSLVVCDTAAPRRLGSSAYNTRRSECETGVRLIAERVPEVRSLRDVNPAMLERYRDLLPEVVGRRCEHVVNENERVMAAVSALAADDLEALRRLFAASHQSLRDLFEVSSPELDTMVEIASGVSGVVATRMTGAGFGGCTINLVQPGAEDSLRDRVMTEYPKRSGLTPRVYVVQAVDGAGPLVER